MSATSSTAGAVAGAWGQLLRVMLDSWPHYLAACARLELPPTQAHALLRLRDRDPTRMGDLADLLNVDPSTVTGVVDRLEARGLIERLTEQDRRARRVALTERGLVVRDELVRSLARVPASVDALPPAEQEQVAEALALLGRGPCATFPLT